MKNSHVLMSFCFFKHIMSTHLLRNNVIKAIIPFFRDKTKYSLFEMLILRRLFVAVVGYDGVDRFS